MDALFIYNIFPMLQNKIYQNFILEIIKTFLIVLLGLSIIALTIRAVSFLDLIVDSGYSVKTYFQYCFFNLFGVITKFIPFSFLISLTIFISKQIQENEFTILWVSGVKKIDLVNLFFFLSLFIILFYSLFSNLLAPSALNKSRQLLSKGQIDSFLPTVRSQQFSDSFKGFTLLVEKKVSNQIENIFLNDKSRNLKNITTNSKAETDTTILAKNGIVKDNNMVLFKGYIINSDNKTKESDIVKFEQLKVNLSELKTTTIKKPKLQETSTVNLLECVLKNIFENRICSDEMKSEIIPTLNRRLVLPFYIPVLSLICSLLLIKRRNIIFNKFSIFFYSFLLILFSELAVRYTGLNNLMRLIFIISPFVIATFIYLILILKFRNETKILG